MSLTVADVIALPELSLVLRTTTASLVREVRWVAVSEHLDPTPWLASGDLLLTTGLALDLRRSALRDYVGRLAAAEVAGLGFGTGLTHQVVPQALVDAADAHGFPLFEVPEPVPFVALSKAVSRLLSVNERNESAAAFDSQRRLLRIALEEGAAAPEGSILGVLARHVGGYSLILDAAGEVCAAHPPSAAVHAATLRTEVERLRTRGALASASIVTASGSVTVLPVGAHGPAERFLVVGGPRPLRPVDQGVLALAVSLLARPPRRGAQSGAWRELLVRCARSGGMPVDLLGDLGLGGIRPETAVAVIVRGEAAEAAGWAGLHSECADLVLTRAVSGPGQAAVWEGFAGVDSHGAPSAVLEAIAQASGVRAVGVSGCHDLRDPANVQQALDQARRAAQGAGLRRYGVDRVGGVADLLDAAAVAAWATAYIGSMAAGDDGPDLVATVRAWLAHHGQVDAAAHELGIHRHTVRHRLRRAQIALGRSLDDPDVRADLWFALRASVCEHEVAGEVDRGGSVDSAPGRG